jgi:hypothetical protein
MAQLSRRLVEPNFNAGWRGTARRRPAPDLDAADWKWRWKGEEVARRKREIDGVCQGA